MRLFTNIFSICCFILFIFETKSQWQEGTYRIRGIGPKHKININNHQFTNENIEYFDENNNELPPILPNEYMAYEDDNNDIEIDINYIDIDNENVHTDIISDDEYNDKGYDENEPIDFLNISNSRRQLRSCDERRRGRKNNGYRGCQTRTVRGYTCQKWTRQSPHRHGNTPRRRPGKGLGNHNYCRNPDGERDIWCYTTSRRKRWDYCKPLSKPTRSRCIYQRRGSIRPRKGKRLRNINIENDMIISMNIKLNRYPRTTWGNIIHIGKRNTIRQPAIWINRHRYFHVVYGTRRNWNRLKNMHRVRLGKTYKIEFRIRSNGYTVYIDGRRWHTVRNRRHHNYRNQPLYLSDPWHEAANGEVSNLKIMTGTNPAVCKPPKPTRSRCIYQRRGRIRPRKGKRLRNINIENDMIISMEIKLNRYPRTTWGNIIHIGKRNTIRQPAIWINKRKYFHVVYGTKRNWNRLKNMHRVRLGKKYKIEFRIRYNGYTVYINGRRWHTVRNREHHNYKNQPLYISDPWHEAANGEISNLKIMTGTNPGVCKPPRRKRRRKRKKRKKRRRKKRKRRRKKRKRRRKKRRKRRRARFGKWKCTKSSSSDRYSKQCIRMRKGASRNRFQRKLRRWYRRMRKRGYAGFTGLGRGFKRGYSLGKQEAMKRIAQRNAMNTGTGTSQIIAQKMSQRRRRRRRRKRRRRRNNAQLLGLLMKKKPAPVVPVKKDATKNILKSVMQNQQNLVGSEVAMENQQTAKFMQQNQNEVKKMENVMMQDQNKINQLLGTITKGKNIGLMRRPRQMDVGRDSYQSLYKEYLKKYHMWYQGAKGLGPRPW